MPATTATNRRPRRDGRNSAKRLLAARKSAEAARRIVECNARHNAGTAARLIERCGLVSDVQHIQWDWIKVRDYAEFMAEFLGLRNAAELGSETGKNLLRKHFDTLWARKFQGRAHKSCEKRAREDLYLPSYYHVGPGTCVCCGRSLGCEHKRSESLDQATCRARGIYHGGRCYSVSHCLDCGEIQAVDSSD